MIATRKNFGQHVALLAKYAKERRASLFLDVGDEIGVLSSHVMPASKLLAWVSAVAHDAECPHGAVCRAHAVIDAAIFVAHCTPWEVALYNDSDRRDFEQMRANVIKWKNWRAISE